MGRLPAPAEVRDVLLKSNAAPLPTAEFVNTRIHSDVFTKFDVDNSGELDYGEVRRILRFLEIKMSNAGMKEIFKEIDSDGSG